MAESDAGKTRVSPVNVDAMAPVVCMSETFIHAPVAAVWEVLSDLSHWPAWNRSVSSIHVAGHVEPGTPFKWVAWGARIRSRLQQVDPPHTIAWTGRTLGLDAIHIWHLDGKDDGTSVRTEESYEGLLARLFPDFMTRALQKTLDQALDELKTESQSRSGWPHS